MAFVFSSQTVDLSERLQDNPEINAHSSCSACPLADMNPLPVQGNGKLRTLVVFSHPVKGEYEMGALGVSHAYMRMEQDLQALGVDIADDCWVVPAVRCYPNANVPTKKMYECCRGKLLNTVKRLKPTTVLVVGRNAMHGWIGHQFDIPPQIPNHSGTDLDSGYELWVGHKIPDQQYAFDVDGTTVCPTVIPLFNMHDVTKLEQNNMSRGVSSIVPMKHAAILRMAVEHARAMLNRGVKGYAKYAPHASDGVVKVWDAKEAVAVLRALNKPSILALDYETTGLKPYDAGHHIVMVGLSTAEASYAMPFFDHDKEFMQAYRDLMVNPAVRKVCHNLKFEYNWTRRIVGCEMQGILWDTMLVAHILDMRDGISGLKVQGYLKFGMAGYEKVTKKLLSPVVKDRGSNSKNWLQYLNPMDFTDNFKTWDLLLSYVAEDAALTRLLYIRQKEELMDTDYKYLMKGIKLFMDSIPTLAEMEFNGFVFDREQCRKNKELIEQQMVEKQRAMLETKEYAKWKHKYPDKELNTGSPKQMQEFLYDILGHPVEKYSKKGNPSTDKDVLEQLNTEFTNLLCEYKALDKMANSFLKLYEAEANDDGRLRCFFNLNTVKSYRSSSSDPNLQNVSHHSDVSKYALNLMKPLPGHVMLNADFRALEVFGSACYTHDASMLTYLADSKTDMHRDVACQLYFYDASELPKRLRSHTKTLVFSQFYGAGYKSSAKNQWKGLLPEDKERLKEHGISNFDAFEAHVKQIIWHFWNVRFKDFYKWRQKNFAFYIKYGYIVNHTGFLYTGIMNSRQVSNFPIQGSSAHILLKLANYVHKYMIEHDMKSKLISTVHDSLMLSAVPGEVPIIYGVIQEFLSQMHGMEPWTAGLDFEVEVEKSEVDGSWFTVKPDVKISGSKIIQLGA